MASGNGHHGSGLSWPRAAGAATLLAVFGALGTAAAQSEPPDVGGSPADHGSGSDGPGSAPGGQGAAQGRAVSSGSRSVLPARPLSVKSTSAAQPAQPASGAPASPGVASGAPAQPPSVAAVPGAVHLSEAPPDRLSPLCRAAAQRLLQHRRRGAPLSAAEQVEQDDFRRMHLDCFNATGAGLTSGAAGVGEELLRSVAQVVLKRAQASAFRLLRDRLLDAAGCDAPLEPRFSATCAALRSVPIEDLTSSPAVLLDAVIADFLPMVIAGLKAPWMRATILEDALRESAVRWRESGAGGVQSGFAQIIRRRMKEQVQKPDCELATSATDKALWVSGMCLIEAQAPANFARCDVDGWTSQCTDPVTTNRILRLWSIFARRFGAQGKVPLSDDVDLACTAADITIDEAPGLLDERRREAHDGVAAIRALLGGIAHKDWIETTSGAVRVLRLLATRAACDGDAESAACKRSRAVETLFTLLAAVGNYAETFADGAKDGAATREKILESLVDRMVNRAHRDRGLVVSAGGNLGLFGGARMDLAGSAQVAFPVQLGLGVGIQSYGTGNHGFYAMATAFDLGQYVTFSSGSLEVPAPALESSVVLGLTAGGWVALRETPFYIGAYGGVSPFVKANERPTFQLGLTTGIYVPLLDFN